MTSKEVPKEVQFCSAITCGDTYAAKQLLPQINLFQKIDFGIGISPVVFCLWAARQSPDIAIKKLNDYFPNANYDHDVTQKALSKANIAQTLNDVLISDNQLLSSLGTTLLSNIVKVAPLETQGDPEDQRFILSCCVAALEFIRDATHFRQGIKDAALKFSAILKPYAGEKTGSTEKNHETQTLPDCMRKLMSFLNEDDNKAEATFLSSKQPRRDYLPAQRRIAQLTEQIREESNFSEPDQSSSSADNVISFLVPSQQRQH